VFRSRGIVNGVILGEPGRKGRGWCDDINTRLRSLRAGFAKQTRHFARESVGHVWRKLMTGIVIQTAAALFRGVCAKVAEKNSRY